MILDKIYVITLDHSQESYNSILDRIGVLNLPEPIPYEIIQGVNGRELFVTEEGRSTYGIKFYDNWVQSGSPWWGRGVTTGEAGGICSHIKIWEDVHKNGYNRVLILEDDFVPTGPFDWNSLNELTDYDYDIAFLSRILQGQHNGVVDSKIGLKSWVKPGYSFQTHSYILTNTGVEKLVSTNLKTLKENIIVSDEFLPATYTWHPRQDLRSMYNQNMNAVAYIDGQCIRQSRFEAINNSLTSPIEGIDY